MGIGSDNVYLINTDSRGKMDPKHLESEIERYLCTRYLYIVMNYYEQKFKYSIETGDAIVETIRTVIKYSNRDNKINKRH